MSDKKIGLDTFRLFKRPSFIAGMAALLNFGGNINKYSADSSGQEADANSLKSDWTAIGNDMRTAITDYESAQTK